MAYDQAQWIESFEGQMSILRPHMTGRLLATVSLQEWHSRGSRKGEDPVEAAKAVSRDMDERPNSRPRS